MQFDLERLSTLKQSQDLDLLVEMYKDEKITLEQFQKARK